MQSQGQTHKKQYTKLKNNIEALFDLVFVEEISSTKYVSSGVFLANYLASTDN